MNIIKNKIRNIPDYPKPGINFKDVTTLMREGDVFKIIIEEMVSKLKDEGVDKIVGIDARGLIFGAPVAYAINAGFVPVRKTGKLPAKKISQEYELEYGFDSIEIHEDAISKGERVVLIDDLIATGGTALAAIQLIKKLQGEIVCCHFVVDLPNLGGSRKLSGIGLPFYSLCEFID